MTSDAYVPTREDPVVSRGTTPRANTLILPVTVR